MKAVKTTMTKLWKDESAQGMAEWMLLTVALVGALIIFKGKIKEIITEKMGAIKGDIDGFKAE